ncbi:exonuclease II Exo2 [Coemansia spiralis]|uniref:Exonuclease II Exo2 n=2 Tax=Coemansia TaxID=4863 RepID=A0A9W8KZ07_9FUNG|nr:exonuclease II Exo2 [Coemansia umbellata]KAJ2677893.1 exonuclease II Exo2 [Coemansia spiralis]
MGIPKFFRWLSGRYPLVSERVTDDNIPEFDNLYLDMNGIIHNCTHPKDGDAPAPKTDEERFLAIFYYIEFLFNKIRPQKVFFLGIDGVAPRAKMNEQRARRFRTAKELEEQRAKELRQRRANGEIIRKEEEEEYSSDVFDPTCITPGTEFMDRLTEALRYYINKRVSQDADWRKPRIILSAPNVPGEGEHKIMDYIRFSRAQPGYSPNTRHCLYGLDADLIMLGLLSHEPHFSLLREEVVFGPRSRSAGASADPAMQSFYLLHISVLRDYLDHEFGVLKEHLGCSPQYKAMELGHTTTNPDVDADPNAFDLERVIDDYVLMIMLVGNDFLPNLPRLSINSGALNFMFATYIRIRPSLGGYLHDNGTLSLERFEKFMREIARFEIDSFKIEVADHQWYQVYKHKAALRGEQLGESAVFDDGNSRGKKKSFSGKHRGPDVDFEFADGLDTDLGEATIPLKGNKLVISRSQQDMLELIRKFAIRALPKVAEAANKVQIQFLPGSASALDNLIVTKAAELLELHVGHEYAHDGSMALYVAAGSSKAIAKLELEDDESNSDDPRDSDTVRFVRDTTMFSVLGALEDTNGDEGDDYDDDYQGAASSDEKSAVPQFTSSVSDISDVTAVADYVEKCLQDFGDVAVVPDVELDNYTRKGDESDFWQRFELWKAAYYKAKLEVTYNVPNVTESASDEDVVVNSLGQKFHPPPSSIEPMCRSYIGSLQWVLFYYYHGCQSWSWFYPYHYSPCISDLCANLPAYNISEFVKDNPYTPYEQLMCVLPPYSRRLLPPALRPLMVDIHSPIRDMFPTSFSVDMNGKKMPWEAVVLINFVDIERIRSAMASKLPHLSEDETRRNSCGQNMAYSYVPLDVDDESDDVPEYLAPCNLKFPSVRPLKCKGMIYIMPSLKSSGNRAPLQLIHGLIDGSVTRARMRPGFPSLFTATHKSYLEFNGTEVFGSPSRDETMMVELLSNALDQAGSAEAMSSELLNGKQVRGKYHPRRLFVSWPSLRDAVLVGISDASGVYTVDSSGSNIIYREYDSPAERQIWTKKYMDAVQTAKRTLAIVAPSNPRVLIHVLPLRGLQLYPDGSLVRDYGFLDSYNANPSKPWADVSMWPELGVQSFITGLVSVDLAGAWVNNPRFQEHSATPLDRAYPIAERVFFLGRTPLYGSPGKVIGHSRDQNGAVVGVDLQLVSNVDFGAIKHENFLGINALTHHLRTGHEQYKPSFIVARELGMSPLLLSRITSKMAIFDGSKAGDSVRIQIGLDLKFEARRLKVVGYSKRGPNGWQFSGRAIDLIARYKEAFPDMFRRLEVLKPNDDILTATECFAPEQQNSLTAADIKLHVANEVKRVKQWMKANINSESMAQVPIASELLSKEQIDAIADMQAALRPYTTKKVVVRDVHREAVLRPVNAQYLLQSQALMVGHRIIYIADRNGCVPFGARGYVVAIHARKSDSRSGKAVNNQHIATVHQEGLPADKISMVEILLDKPFIDGTSLDGRCPPYRGALVRPHQILDLTSWGLGQNVTSKPTSNPRAVNVIKPAPDIVKHKDSHAVSSRGAAATTVSIREPSKAPWADLKNKGTQQTSKDKEHANKIITQLKKGLAAQQAPSASTSMPSAKHTTSATAEEKTHARNIINKLLSGSMEKMSIGNNAVSATTTTAANTGRMPSSTSTVLHSHPPVAGQHPIVIEDEYFSDSMDEDEDEIDGHTVANGSQTTSANHHQVYYNYDSSNNRGRGRGGRGRGHGHDHGHGRGRGRGRGHASQEHFAHAHGQQHSSSNSSNRDSCGRGRRRSRGRGRGGVGHHTDV